MCTRAAMTARVVIVDVRSRSARLQQRDSGSVLDEPRIAWEVAPSHREHVAGPISDDGCPPTANSIFLRDHEVADTDVIPVARISLGNIRCRGGGVRIRGLSRIVGRFSGPLVVTTG